MKYDKRPCSASDCNNWINDPDICEKCMETSFIFEIPVKFTLRERIRRFIDGHWKW